LQGGREDGRQAGHRRLRQEQGDPGRHRQGDCLGRLRSDRRSLSISGCFRTVAPSSFLLGSPRLHPLKGGMWMGLIATLIVGLIVGAIAKLLMPGRDPGGIIVTILLGVAGSFVAAFLGRAIGWYRDPGSGPGIIASVIGAMILLFLYRVIVG